jgi:hypothetical protein
MQIPYERRLRQTQFTKREILDIVNDPTNNPYDGGLHYSAPPSGALAKLGGMKLKSGAEYEFCDKNRLRYLERAIWKEAYYECYEAAPGILFFFHMRDKSVPPPQMTAMCVDLNTNRVTVNDAQIGHDDYTPRDVSNRVSFTSIVGRGAVTGEAHCFTDDFVGKVAAWDVGGFWLTHHYINPMFFLNEIPGRGPNSILLTIAEPAQYVKIAENIYVFTWREMAGPGLMGMDVMDWSRMSSVGVFYGISENDRLECYSFTRARGKWLSIDDRKRMHREGIHAVVGLEAPETLL